MTNAAQANKHDSDTLDMHTPNLVDDNVKKIMALFPNCITESEDENGKLKKAVDFDLLRQELSQSLVEGGQERYRLDWPGKRQAILEANSPIAKTLRPARDESVNFDTTENLFIEGDNLEALKLLQESYLGQVKMIYIDPPYNTGNDFIYKDDFSEDTVDFLKRSEQIDEEGNRLVDNFQRNSENNGRFHSDWLTMMYSRLKLARNLLRDDGVIFISIDDNEASQLKNICDEVFGSNNFIAQYIHKNNSIKNQAKLVSVSTEYIYGYAKNKSELQVHEWRIKKKGVEDISALFTKLNKSGLNLDEIEIEIKDMYKRPKYSHLSRWNKVDKHGVFKDSDLSREGGPRNYTIRNPVTGDDCVIPSRGWGKSESELKRLQEEDLIWYGDPTTPPGMKDYIGKDDIVVPDNFFYFDNSVDTRWIKDAFEYLVFQNPKPLEMIKTIISMVYSEDGDIIMDFFSGSSTTAHATLQSNIEDNIDRKFIMVQIPEVLNPKDKNHKDGFEFCKKHSFEPKISEISKERIRRAGKKIVEDNQDKEGIENLDIGFRVLKIDSTNMKEVYYTPDEYSQAELDNLESHIKEDRTGEDLLFQVMLDWGVPLSLPIEVKQIQGSSVYYVGIDSLVACFDTLTTDLVDEVAKEKPLKFVSSELAIAHDQDKTNIKARFAQLSPDTQVKFI